MKDVKNKEYTLLFHVDTMNKSSRIKRVSGALDISAAVTLKEMKFIKNEPDVQSMIRQSLPENKKTKEAILNIDVYDVLEKIN